MAKADVIDLTKDEQEPAACDDIQGSSPKKAALVLNGEPRALQRPRIKMDRKRSKAWLYDPDRLLKGKVNAEASRKLPTVPFFEEGPVKLEVVFHMRRPVSHFASRGANRSVGLNLKAEALAEWPRSPDLDNLIKFLLDSLEGALFVNDRQVVRVVASKVYDSLGECNGRTEIFAQSDKPQ